MTNKVKFDFKVYTKATRREKTIVKKQICSICVIHRHNYNGEI